MWFGVAPAPAPSPRTNTKAWHPPHCSCCGGKPAAESSTSQPQPQPSPLTSPRRLRAGAGDRYLDAPLSPRRAHSRCSSITGSPTKSSSPRAPTAAVAASATTHSARQSNMTTIHATAPNETLLLPSPLLAPLPSRRKSRGAGAHIVNNGHESVGFGRRLSGMQDVMTRHDHYQPNPEYPELDLDLDKCSLWPQPSSRGSTNNNDMNAEAEHRIDDRPKHGLADGFPSQAEVFLRPITSSRLRSRGLSRGSVLDTTITPPSRAKSRRASRGRGSVQNSDPSIPSPRSDSSAAVPTCMTLTAPAPHHGQPDNLVGHTSSVGAVLVDDDGRYLVSCSIDGSVKVWSCATFECLQTLYGHTDSVSCVALSRRWLVSGSHDTTLRVYSTTTRFSLLHDLRGHSAHVTRVHLPVHLPHYVLSGSDDATLRLWQIEDGACVREFASHSTRVTCLLVSGTRLCSGAADASICFWDLDVSRDNAHEDEHVSRPCLYETEATTPRSIATAPSLKTFHVHRATVQCLYGCGQPVDSHTGDDGDFVFSGSSDGTIQWFNARLLQHLGQIDSLQSPVYTMALDRTTGCLACSTGDGRVIVYSDITRRVCLPPSTGTIPKRELRVSDRWISSLQLIRAGSLLVCGSEEQLVLVNLKQPKIERIFETAHGFINSVRWLEGSQRIVTSGEDNVIKIWRLS